MTEPNREIVRRITIGQNPVNLMAQPVIDNLCAIIAEQANAIKDLEESMTMEFGLKDEGNDLASSICGTDDEGICQTPGD